MSDSAPRERLEELFLATLELDAKDSSPIDTPVLDRLEEHGPQQGAAERLPERVGHYAVKSILGIGGMGIVYGAAQESPSRLVALKLLRPELPGGTAQKRFEREAEFPDIGNSTTHPAILIAVASVGMVKGTTRLAALGSPHCYTCPSWSLVSGESSIHHSSSLEQLLPTVACVGHLAPAFDDRTE